MNGKDDIILELRGITKRFGDLVANDRIDLSFQNGEIHTLFGENGAGKSTLSNVIYGYHRPDEGEILVKGTPVQFHSPKDAIKAGIGMVHQHFMLVPTLSVIKNIILGLPTGHGPFLNLKNLRYEIGKYFKKFNIDLDLDTEIWKLSVGEQQLVEIIKALYLGIEILILDEPTAVLSPHEIESLLNRVRELKAEGLTIIFISHKIKEIMQISDRVTVLRRGKKISTVSRGRASEKELVGMEVGKDELHELGFSANELVKMMIGKEVMFHLEKEGIPGENIVLRLDNIQADSDRGYQGLNGLSLEVREGEILGIAGVAGNGQTELYEVITGIRPMISGEIVISGKNVSQSRHQSFPECKISEIPEDRIRDGCIANFTIAENLIFGQQEEKRFLKGPLLNPKKIRDHAENLIDEYDIRPRDPGNIISNLSGGNIQRVILAREFSVSPNLIVASQPSRGLDLVATEFVRKKLLEKRLSGTAVLLFSEDLEELMILSDRIAVIFKGQIIAVMKPEETTIEKIGFLMVGGKEKQ